MTLGLGDEGRLVEVGAHAGQHRRIALPQLDEDARGAERQQVVDRPGHSLAAHAHLLGVHRGVGRPIERRLGEVGGRIDDGGDAAAHALQPRAAPAGGAVDRPVGRDVVLGLGDAEDVGGVHVGPGLEPVAVPAGRQRHRHAGRDVGEAERRVVALLLVAVVERHAHALAAEVHAHDGSADLLRLAVDRRVAVAIDAVEAHAELLVVAEAAGEVDIAADLRARGEGRGHAVQRLVAGPLGHQVEHAADAAERRHAVQQHARPLQELDALEVFRRHHHLRRHRVHAVEGVVLVAEREAAHERHGHVVGRRQRVAHRRIVGQHVHDAARLLVGDDLGRVVALVERRIHEAALAQDAELAAGRDLAAGIRRRQVVDGGLRGHRELALHLHGIELHRARAAGDTGHRHGARRGELIGKAAAREQLAQRLLGRHRAAHRRARLARGRGWIEGDLQAGLATERRQRLRQRLCRNVEGRRLVALRFEERRRFGCHLVLRRGRQRGHACRHGARERNDGERPGNDRGHSQLPTKRAHRAAAAHMGETRADAGIQGPVTKILMVFRTPSGS